MTEQIAHSDPNLIQETTKLNGATNGAAVELVAADDVDDLEDEKDFEKGSAYLVIEKNMLFWQNKADEILKRILEFLDKHENLHGVHNGERIARICQVFGKNKEQAVDAAAKLIPFQAPKLSNIELKNKHTHRFVIRAPSVAANSQAWLAQITRQQSAAPQLGVAPKNFENLVIEDAALGDHE